MNFAPEHSDTGPHYQKMIPRIIIMPKGLPLPIWVTVQFMDTNLYSNGDLCQLLESGDSLIVGKDVVPVNILRVSNCVNGSYDSSSRFQQTKKDGPPIPHSSREKSAFTATLAKPYAASDQTFVPCMRMTRLKEFPYAADGA